MPPIGAQGLNMSLADLHGLAGPRRDDTATTSGNPRDRSLSPPAPLGGAGPRHRHRPSEPRLDGRTRLRDLRAKALDALIPPARAANADARGSWGRKTQIRQIWHKVSCIIAQCIRRTLEKAVSTPETCEQAAAAIHPVISREFRPALPAQDPQPVTVGRAVARKRDFPLKPRRSHLSLIDPHREGRSKIEGLHHEILRIASVTALVAGTAVRLSPSKSPVTLSSAIQSEILSVCESRPSNLSNAQYASW